MKVTKRQMANREAFFSSYGIEHLHLAKYEEMALG